MGVLMLVQSLVFFASFSSFQFASCFLLFLPKLPIAYLSMSRHNTFLFYNMISKNESNCLLTASLTRRSRGTLDWKHERISYPTGLNADY